MKNYVTFLLKDEQYDNHYVDGWKVM
jgi:hypothetical protein